MAPPIKTTISDIDGLFSFLKGQVGWVPLERIRKTIDSKLSDNRKLEASRYLGLIERDGTNVKLSESGRVYANGSESDRTGVMLAAVKRTSLYFQTIEWIHHNNKTEPTKTDIGNYWHDRLQSELDGAKDAAITDAAIFFFRVADAAGLGKFISPGRGRPIALLRSDLEAIGRAVTGEQVVPVDGGMKPVSETSSLEPNREPSPVPLPPLAPLPGGVKASPDIHINIQIHIAADATAETVEEIFKNMRKYVLDDGE